jgi:UDP-glucose 4-epimerase
VLVAGAGGFIGRRLVALLRRSGVVVPDTDRRACDLRSPDDTRRLLDRHRPRVVVNLARPTHAADGDHHGHDEIVRNLIAGARSAGAERVIQLGSSTEFGPAESPADDDAPLRPTTPYGAAKASASSLALAADGEEIRTTVLRPFCIYGPGDLRRHLIPAAIEAASTGGTLPLAPSVRRDWVFVDDVALGCLLALDGRADGLAVNLASGVAVSNQRVVELVGELAGRPIETDPGAISPRPWDAGLAGSTERARQVLGWTAATSLRDGIRTTLDATRPTEGTARIAAAG